MFSVVEMLACPNRPLTADTGTWSAISKVALEWRKLWKWAEVRSFAFKNLLNQLVMLCGSNGAPSALVKIRSFLMVLPHISTVRTHADPMRKRCSRCIWRYSRSSSINHVDNRSLYYHTINRESNKLLIDKMHECFHLLQQIQDKDISGKLYLAISDAVDIAEDHAFDVGAALQAAISEDELTAHDE